MTAAWKPSGYTSLSPYLICDGAQRVIGFLKNGFGATELRRYDLPDGSIMHAEVRIDDTVVMLADGSPQHPATKTMLHIYVPDVDAAYQRLLAAGGVSAQEPQQREGDPDRRGGVTDPSGNSWYVSTQLSA